MTFIVRKVTLFPTPKAVLPYRKITRHTPLFTQWRRGDWFLHAGRYWVWLVTTTLDSHAGATLNRIVDNLVVTKQIAPVTESHYLQKLAGELFYSEYLNRIHNRAVLLSVDGITQAQFQFHSLEIN